MHPKNPLDCHAEPDPFAEKTRRHPLISPGVGNCTGERPDASAKAADGDRSERSADMQGRRDG